VAADIDIGCGVTIRWIDDDTGLQWKHPNCRPWFHLHFKPHPTSTGHTLERREPLTVGGSLLCPKGCGFHGHITDGKWVPA